MSDAPRGKTSISVDEYRAGLSIGRSINRRKQRDYPDTFDRSPIVTTKQVEFCKVQAWPKSLEMAIERVLNTKN